MTRLAGVRARWTTNPRNNGITVKCHIGRYSAVHLEKKYGLTGLTAADTALSATTNVQVSLTMAGVTDTQTITDMESNPDRNILAWEFDNLASGDYTYTVQVVGSGNIEGSATGIAKIWSADRLNVAAGSCMRLDVVGSNLSGISPSADPDDDYPASPANAQPVNGDFSLVAKQIVAGEFDGMCIVDDVMYIQHTINAIDPEQTWFMPPVSLTDTGNDDPAALGHVSDYAVHIAGLSHLTTTSAEAQNLYLRYEGMMSRPEMWDISGVCWLQFMYGDHEFPQNNFDHSWWSIGEFSIPNPSSNRMDFSVAVNQVNVDPDFDPFDIADEPNIATLMTETCAVYRVCRHVFELYCGAGAQVRLAGMVNNPPWIVTTHAAGGDYTASDYLPLTMHIDHPRCSIFIPDFYASSDLLPYSTHNVIAFDEAGENWLGMGARAIDSPLGDSNDATIRTAITNAITAKKNVFICSPDQIGAAKGGNSDGLHIRAPAWLGGFKDYLVALPYSIAIFGGDHHVPSVVRLDDDFVSITGTPLASYNTTTTGARASNDFSEPPTFGIDETLVTLWDAESGNGYDEVRQAFAGYQVDYRGAVFYGKDNRSEFFSSAYKLNWGGVKALQNAGLAVPSLQRLGENMFITFPMIFDAFNTGSDLRSKNSMYRLDAAQNIGFGALLDFADSNKDSLVRLNGIQVTSAGKLRLFVEGDGSFISGDPLPFTEVNVKSVEQGSFTPHDLVNWGTFSATQERWQYDTADTFNVMRDRRPILVASVAAGAAHPTSGNYIECTIDAASARALGGEICTDLTDGTQGWVDGAGIYIPNGFFENTSANDEVVLARDQRGGMYVIEVTSATTFEIRAPSGDLSLSPQYDSTQDANWESDHGLMLCCPIFLVQLGINDPTASSGIGGGTIGQPTLGADGYLTSQSPDNTLRQAVLGADGYEVPDL